MEQKLPIFIINLQESTDRKASIINQIESLNKNNQSKIDYQFFSAINGKKQPDFYLFNKHNKQKRYQIKGNYVTLSQLGCFASHYLLWEKCLKLNKPIIVLEDDIVFQSNFVDIYKFCLSEHNLFEFFWLSPPSKLKHAKKSKKLYSEHSFSINQYYDSWENTNGYFITPLAARKLLFFCHEWIYDVDISMSRYWENKVQYLAVYPPCIKLSTLAEESTIPVYKGKEHRTFFIRCRREFFNFRDLVNKLFYDLFN